ncbi:putative endonuclease [Actimicrobium sp. GrIS 1.19]|uniref:YraN family protein n=1 Tax=Actimicrobium sp. GrIS 1.19 TaxID=3071708 RepID=UPI002E0706FE|nr:putative endonuclease [Actimicrobium sp. GrIS 1.19]
MGLMARLRARASSTDRQIAGDAAEDRALAHLQQHGLTLVERNFLCKAGELDLIMQDAATLVFVEVRQRSGQRHGGAAASITRSKQIRLTHAAQRYLQRYRHPPPCRFDVVAIDGAVITWLQNAIDS